MPFQLVVNVTLSNSWNGLVNVTFTLHLLNHNAPISNTFKLLKVCFRAVCLVYISTCWDGTKKGKHIAKLFNLG